jgi:hypothetical protein
MGTCSSTLYLSTGRTQPGRLVEAILVFQNGKRGQSLCHPILAKRSRSQRQFSVKHAKKKVCEANVVTELGLVKFAQKSFTFTTRC